MGEELTKLEIGDISKLIAAIYITDTDFRKILLKRVMGAFKTSHQNTNIQYGFGGTKPDQHAIDYLQERVFILSDKTTSKLEGDLRFELLEGLKNNESISAITKRLDGIFSDMMPWQLERISRTEILNAQNAGRMSAYEKSGAVKYKMWQAAINNARTAADSKRLHGQIQKLSDPFVDPKTGDTFMHPPNRPQCRCTLIPLRKPPDDVITTGGLMYAADKKVGKIEINTKSLSKNEKRVWIPPSKRAVGHWRKVKGAKIIETEKKFTMSEKGANKWAKDSIYKDFVYHGTTIESAGRIESGGFADSKIGIRTGNAGMYGRGFYFGINKGSASGFAEGPTGLLKIKINVKKLCNLECWRELDKKYKLWDIFEKDVMEAPTKVRDILIKEGYDGVHVISDIAPSYGEICVFNPKNIMVVK